MSAQGEVIPLRRADGPQLEVVSESRIRSTEGRVPPHDLDAEAAVLSAVMVDPSAYNKIAGYVLPEHFSSESHRQIFAAVVDLASRDLPVDIVQVGSWLKSRERITQVGGMPYLTEILNAAPAVTNVRAYATTIVGTARARRLIAKCQRIAAEGYFDHGDHDEWVTARVREVEAIGREAQGVAVERNLDALKRIIKRTHEHAAAVERGDKDRHVVGLSTGIVGYDWLTNGLHSGQVTVLAALRGVGKTALALAISAHVAAPRLAADGRSLPQTGVAWFQLDTMSRENCLERMLCARARVPADALRTGNVAGSLSRIVESANEIAQWPLVIDDTKELDIDAITARARGLVGDPRFNGAPLGLIVVDYFQKVRPQKGREREKRCDYLRPVAEGLGKLASEMKIPIIVLAQPKNYEEKGEPDAGDIADCSELGNVARCMVFVQRGWADQPPPKGKRKVTEDDGRRTLLLVKQSFGRSGGRIELQMDGEQCRFTERGDPGPAPAVLARAPSPSQGPWYERDEA